ncbi:MAG TPA: M23 family metallopeptidase [Methylomirabilota bacterium]|nr:M23 family metallopeptidase [Methylomirabilota bacterium]
MAQVGGAVRHRPPRLEVRVPLTRSADISFGLVIRKPRRRRRKRSAFRRWTSTFVLAGCCVIAGVIPIWTVIAAPELERVGAMLLAKPQPPLVARTSAATVDRAVVIARGAPVTSVRKDPPGLQLHAVVSGETLLSIAARYEITPQTLAYNNGIKDTAELRSGQSLVIPPIDAAIHVVRDGDTLSGIAASFGADPDTVRTVNSVAFEPADVTTGRVILVPVPEGLYPGFRLVVSDAPRVFAPRIRWPTQGIVTQLFGGAHTGIDIAALYGSAVVASDSGTVTWVGWRGSGGLAVCVLVDWGLEVCDYHLSATQVELGERVVTGQRIASVGSSGVSTGPHVHWEARTNGVLVDPMTYAPAGTSVVRVGGATGSP